MQTTPDNYEEKDGYQRKKGKRFGLITKHSVHIFTNQLKSWSTALAIRNVNENFNVIALIYLTKRDQPIDADRVLPALSCLMGLYRLDTLCLSSSF